MNHDLETLLMKLDSGSRIFEPDQLRTHIEILDERARVRIAYLAAV